jgi:hypothetical protein
MAAWARHRSSVATRSFGTSKAIDGLKDESAKAQTFAAHMDPGKVSEAISDYQALRKTL